MKKAIVLAGLLLVISCALMFWPREGKCAWCPSYTCYGSSSCGPSCVCVKFGGEVGGHCASVQVSNE